MTENIKINAIVAMCNDNNGIGVNYRLAWNISDDHLYYLRVVNTLKNKQKLNAVIYGRKTYEGLPKKELPGDRCIKFILSKTKTKKEINPNNDDKIFLCLSQEEIFGILNNKYKEIIENVYALGGHKIYEDAMKFSNFDKFYITRIFKHFDCDVMIKPKDFISIYLKKIEDKNFLK